MEMVVFILIVVFGIVGLFLFHDASEKAKSDQVKQQLKQIVELTEPHYPALSVKRRQLVFRDSYGQEVLDKWYRELEYFINTVLRKDQLASDFLGYSEKQILSEQTQRGMKSLLSEFRQGKLGIVRDLLDAHICGFIGNDGTEPADNSVEDLSPVEFELFCCRLLTMAGWDANTTVATGDQGIDIIAYRDGVKAVFQCKKYSQPVGNAAVQEIISGKLFEQAEVAAVVTNTSYTTSAKQLANSLDVKLLHYSELASFMNAQRQFGSASKTSDEKPLLDSFIGELNLADDTNEEPWADLLYEADTFRYGLNGKLEDPNKALELYKLAAKLGSGEAYMSISELSFDLFGEAKGFECLKLGAEKNVPECWLELASIFSGDHAFYSSTNLNKSDSQKCYLKFFELVDPVKFDSEGSRLYSLLRYYIDTFPSANDENDVNVIKVFGVNFRNMLLSSSKNPEDTAIKLSQLDHLLSTWKCS